MRVTEAVGGKQVDDAAQSVFKPMKQSEEPSRRRVFRVRELDEQIHVACGRWFAAGDRTENVQPPDPELPTRRDGNSPDVLDVHLVFTYLSVDARASELRGNACSTWFQ